MWFEEDNLDASGQQPKTPEQSEQGVSVERNMQITQATATPQRVQVLENGSAMSNRASESTLRVSNEAAHVGLPTLRALKEKFSAGKIPQAGDFKQLIDMASIGCSAIGLTPGEGDASPGEGLRLETDGRLHVIASIPKGTIVMFNGDTIPEGWGLCDGRDGRPNLIDRFIIGGALENRGATNGKSLDGAAASKRFKATSGSTKISGTLYPEVCDHKLTEDQLPAHKHHSSIRHLAYSLEYVSDSIKRQRMPVDGQISKIYRIPKVETRTIDGYPSTVMWATDGWTCGFGGNYWDLDVSQRPPGQLQYGELSGANMQDIGYDWSSTSGEGKGHSHNIRIEDDGHVHDVDIEPPYIILAFIIKL
ncbi:hypothetical protein [Pseudomonas koreensis]|uniref:hypothetical protein n=1 Tax=Pseudomonas koreensis TaxID=198620 RepID=UPI003F83B447